MMLTPEEGGIFASGELLQISALAAPCVAHVVVTWLKNRRARKIIFQLEDNNAVHVEATGYSVHEVEQLLEKAHRVSVIQTEKDDADPEARVDPIQSIKGASPFGPGL
jgi:hypothetical protein